MDFFTPGHLIVVAVVALVVLVGWKRLPEMSRSVGRSLRIFKTEMKAMDAEVRDSVTPAADPQASTPTAQATTPAAAQPAPQPAAGTR